MKKMRWLLLAVALAVGNSQFAVRSHAGLFKMDFGQLENERIPLDAEGNMGVAPEALTDWDIIGTWTFADPTANGGKGIANADMSAVTWKLKDFSADGDNDVTLTIMDNKALSELLDAASPPYAVGQTANNPTKDGFAAVYDGVLVPAIVKDDYMYRLPDAAGTELLFRFANLNPGFYNVTAFEGRTTDGNGRYGKIWVDDINGKKEPAAQNTGNYSGVTGSGQKASYGQPRTVTVNVKAGEYLWFAEMEDNSGGISGLIIRSLAAAPPVIDVAASKGLFKLDFGQLQNERIPVDAEGNATGEAPAALKDWNVIATWTFGDPNVNVVAGSASVSGTANANATEVTWKLTDFSSDGNQNVTITILDNVGLSQSLSLDPPTGQTANNPAPAQFEAFYDGVVVPAIVKDDYLYRSPDTAGTELLFRFAGLKSGRYNVTAFEGRINDGNGRYGKVWVDDINGKKEPAVQNTGNYSGVNLDLGGVATPGGNPRTVTVDIKAGEYLWFAEMEDNSGGISGLIIRGVTAATPVGALTGMVGYWHMDETTGTVVHDATGNRHEGKIINNPAGAWVTDPVRGAVYKATGTNVIDFGVIVPAMTTANDFTWSLWIKSDETGTAASPDNNVVFGNRYNSAGADFNPREFIKFTPSAFEWHFGAAGQNVNYDDFVIGTWAHHLVVKQGTKLTYYRDGAESKTGVITGGPKNPQPLYLGGQGAQERWKGLADEVAIFDRALSASEAKLVYDLGKAGQPLAPPALSIDTAAATAANLTITWSGGKAPFKVQRRDNVASGNWTDVGASTSDRTATVPRTGGLGFFRVVSE